MQKNNTKINIVVFAFGFMGNSVFESLINNKLFEIKGVILPQDNLLYFSNIKKINKKIKILYSDKNILILTMANFGKTGDFHRAKRYGGPCMICFLRQIISILHPIEPKLGNFSYHSLYLSLYV